ncbi:MAG: exosortase family protein XrtF [Cyclobacteriaceae bacterium]|nr:exosortase family protein XrtF [Cyclobacteriaceae bacterium]
MGVYILGNIIYGLWVVSYGSIADPLTELVAQHSALLLNLVNLDVRVLPSTQLPNVSLMLEGNVVVNVYEGCNAINVSILFIAFLFAYKGSLKRTLVFSLVGLGSIYLFNLLRVSGLFLVALYFPNHLYLMHKFVFTGVIYAFVFVLWYVWVVKVNHKDHREDTKLTKKNIVSP